MKDTSRSDDPELSVVVLAWDQLDLTRACVESIRATTDVAHELIIVDNGSEADAREYAAQAADIAVLNDANRGFAAGNNQGLERATGEVVMFLNNDTVLPAGWTRLLSTLREHPHAGIVVPALTVAGTKLTVRHKPGTHVGPVNPFGPVPSGVCYVMRTDLARSLGGWNEAYRVASGEDLDLAFTVWVNDLEIVLDERVLVEHVGHGTSDVKLEDRAQLWKKNHRIFVARWLDRDSDVARVEGCSTARFDRNRRVAAAAVAWRDRYERFRDRSREVTKQRDEAWAALERARGSRLSRSARSAVRRLILRALRR